MVKNKLIYPLFSPMNEMKNNDIFYRDRCKEKLYSNELVTPTNNDNKSFITINKIVYTITDSPSNYFTTKISLIGIPNPSLDISVRNPFLESYIAKNQQKIKSALYCNKRIISASLNIFNDIYLSILTDVQSMNKYIAPLLKIPELIEKYKLRRINIEEPYNLNIHHNKLHASHTILIYGWIKHENGQEYWIIRDSNIPNSEYYFPFAKATDEYWFGLELIACFSIDVIPSD